MRIYSQLGIIFVLLFTTRVFALLCPNNFNSINMGDTIAFVKQQCGNPTTEKTSQSTENLPQEWVYYIKMNPSDQATLKSSIAFVNGKVTNMNVNGIGISNTAICGGTIQIGDTIERVKNTCGQPSMIAQNNFPGANIQIPVSTELTYDTNVGSVRLIFENGKLIERK